VTLVQVNGGGLYRPQQAWKNRRDAMGGGVLLDVGIHYVNVLRHWFGEPELAWAAAAPRANPDLEGEDGAVAALRFPGGPAVSLQLSWSAFRGAGTPNVELMGEKGSLKIWFGRSYLLLTAPLSERHWANWLRAKFPGRVAARVGKWLPQVRRRRLRVPGGDLIGSQALLADFVRAITTGAAPATPVRDGLGDLRAVLAMYRAMQTGAAVRPGP
jgi:predicted dehydrogenase